MGLQGTKERHASIGVQCGSNGDAQVEEGRKEVESLRGVGMDAGACKGVIFCIFPGATRLEALHPWL